MTNFTTDNLNRLWTAIEYTLGTIAPGGHLPLEDEPEWIGIHKSRAHQSTEFLREARKLLSEMKKEIPYYVDAQGNSTELEYTIIPVSELEQLQEDSKILAALYTGGVDNWEWYDDSLENID